MTTCDAEFLRAFQTCELSSLSHKDHVRLAWIVLQNESLLSALRTLREGFLAFAESKGRPELFHETITWAFTVLINERIERGRGGSEWHEFADLNRDLCLGLTALDDFYDRATLESELARKTYVMPGRLLNA